MKCEKHSTQGRKGEKTGKRENVRKSLSESRIRRIQRRARISKQSLNGVIGIFAPAERYVYRNGDAANPRAPAERNVYSQDRIATHPKNPVGRASCPTPNQHQRDQFVGNADLRSVSADLHSSFEYRFTGAERYVYRIPK